MQNEQPKIDFFRVREPGEKITATIDFLRENRRWWLRCCVLPLVPLSAVLGWLQVPQSTVNTISHFFWDHFDMGELLFGFTFKNRGLFSADMLVTALALLMLFTSTGALMSLYQYREGRLRGLTWTELRGALRRSLPAAAIITLVAYFLFYFFCSANPLLQLLLLAVFIPFALYAPTSQVGYYPPLRAAGHSLDLGFNTWGGIFMVSAGLALILFFLRGASETLMELLDAYLSDLFFSGNISLEINNIIYCVAAALKSFVSLACLSVMMIGAGYQYGHAEEKYSSVSLYEDVRHFDEI